MRTTCPLEPSRVGVFNVAMCHVHRGTGKVRVAVLRFNYPASPSAVNLIDTCQCQLLCAIRGQHTVHTDRHNELQGGAALQAAAQHEPWDSVHVNVESTTVCEC